ncbi:MAG TPA: ROK family protein [Acidimicrobiales bacterium]
MTAPVPTVGIDLGGTKVYGVRVAGGEVVAETKSKTPVQGGPLGVVDAIAAVVRELDPDGAAPVGVGAPGVIDVERGVVRAAPNLPGWMEPFGLGPALSEALGGVRVVIDNDVNVGVLAEHRLGAARGADEVLGVFVGTGVGGGLVLGGSVRHGPTGMAGEIGHVVVHPEGRICGCGGRGHMEAYAGRAGMERRARELEASGRDTVLVDLAKAKRMTSSVWAKALAQSDAVAIELIDEGVDALGVAIAGVVTVLDLQLVVVGGGLADRLGAAFVGRIEQAVRSRVFAGAKVRVVPAELGDRAGALGAALLVG